MQKKRRCRGFKRELAKFIPHKFCAVCGNDNYVGLTVDHIVPRSIGGAKRDIENVCFLCRVCNSHKSDLAPDAWLKMLFEGEMIRTVNEDLKQLLIATVEHAILFHNEVTSKRILSEKGAVV